jgi:hypothetical protein
VWFHWDSQALRIIGGTTFPANLKRDPKCALGIVDWDPPTGLSQHVGVRGRAEILPFDVAMAKATFRKYFGPDESAWDGRFAERTRQEGQRARAVAGTTCPAPRSRQKIGRAW